MIVSWAAELRKKGKPKRPSIKTLFGMFLILTISWYDRVLCIDLQGSWSTLVLFPTKHLFRNSLHFYFLGEGECEQCISVSSLPSVPSKRNSHGVEGRVYMSHVWLTNSMIVQTQMEAPMAIFKAASSVIYPHLLRFMKVQKHHHQAASHHLPIWVFTNRPHQCIHIKVTPDSRFNPSLFWLFSSLHSFIALRKYQNPQVTWSWGLFVLICPFIPCSQEGVLWGWCRDVFKELSTIIVSRAHWLALAAHRYTPPLLVDLILVDMLLKFWPGQINKVHQK
jgi:hypothetical protein